MRFELNLFMADKMNLHIFIIRLSLAWFGSVRMYRKNQCFKQKERGKIKGD